MENQNQFQEDYYNNSLQRPLPNSTTVLILGIISFVICLCCGFLIFIGPCFGLVCGIIAFILAQKDEKLYAQNPAAFTSGSYSNLKIGRVFAIIGLILSVIYLVSLIVMIIRFGVAMLYKTPDIWRHLSK